jgi:hypothetical protein
MRRHAQTDASLTQFFGMASTSQEHNRAFPYDHPNPTYVRFGDWPADERSMNHITGHREEGVSVYELDKHGDPMDPDYDMDRGEHSEGCGGPEHCDLWEHDPDNTEMHDDTAEMLRDHISDMRRGHNARPDRRAHLVQGELTGFGHDDEPVIQKVKKVGHWPCDVHKFVPGIEPRRPEWCDHEDHEEEESSHHTAATKDEWRSAMRDHLAEHHPDLAGHPEHAWDMLHRAAHTEEGSGWGAGSAPGLPMSHDHPEVLDPSLPRRRRVEGMLTAHFATMDSSLWPKHPLYRPGDRVLHRTPNGNQYGGTVHSVDEPSSPDDLGRVWVVEDGDRAEHGPTGFHPKWLAPHPDAPAEQHEHYHRQVAKNEAGEPYVPERERDIDESDRTTVYHLTDKHDFSLDTSHRPHNNTTMGGHLSPRLFVGSPTTWAEGEHHYRRPYVAELDVPKGTLTNVQGYLGENEIHARHFDKAKVKRVVPYSEYRREEDEPGYRSPVDTRTWSPEQHREHLRQHREHLHAEHGWGWNEFDDDHNHVGLDDDDWDEHMPDPSHGYPGTYVRRDKQGQPMRVVRSTLMGHFASADRPTWISMAGEQAIDPLQHDRMTIPLEHVREGDLFRHPQMQDLPLLRAHGDAIHDPAHPSDTSGEGDDDPVRMFVIPTERGMTPHRHSEHPVEVYRPRQAAVGSLSLHFASAEEPRLHSYYRGIYLGGDLKGVPKTDGTIGMDSVPADHSDQGILDRFREHHDWRVRTNQISGPDHPAHDRLPMFGSHWTTDYRLAHQFALDSSHGRYRVPRPPSRATTGVVLEMQSTVPPEPDRLGSQFGETEVKWPGRGKVERVLAHVHRYDPAEHGEGPIAFHRADTHVRTFEVPREHLEKHAASGDYRGSHQAPGPDNPALHEVPDDFLEHPEYYGVGKAGPASRYHCGVEHENAVDGWRGTLEGHAQARAAKGNPEHPVTVFRSVPKHVEHLHSGDWVTLSSRYAQRHAESNLEEGAWKILKATVPAKHVNWDWGDAHEWGYNGPDIEHAEEHAERHRPLPYHDEDGSVIRPEAKVAAKAPLDPAKITPEHRADIRKIVHDIRTQEGQGGQCGWVSEVLAHKYGWEHHGGWYHSKDGRPIGDHQWNVHGPTGTIIDATADQHGEGHSIRVVPPGHPDHKRYTHAEDEEQEEQWADQSRAARDREGDYWWAGGIDAPHVVRYRKKERSYDGGVQDSFRTAAKDDEIDDLVDLIGGNRPPKTTPKWTEQDEADRQRRIKEHQEWQAKRPGLNPGDDIANHPMGKDYQHAEWVPIEVAQRFRDHHGDQHKGSEQTVAEIHQQLTSGRGLTDPLMLIHHNESGRARLGEGNHRLVAMERAGWSHVPMRVVRMYDSEAKRGLGKTIPYHWRGSHQGETPDVCKPSEVLSKRFLESRGEPGITEPVDSTPSTKDSGAKEASHGAEDRREGHRGGGPRLDQRRGSERGPLSRLRRRRAGAGGSGVEGPGARPLTFHPKAKKEISKFDKPSQKSIQTTLEALQRGDENLQTHKLTGRLSGWYSTKASRGHRIVHQTTDEGGIHVGAVSLHDYTEAINRLGAQGLGWHHVIKAQGEGQYPHPSEIEAYVRRRTGQHPADLLWTKETYAVEDAFPDPHGTRSRTRVEQAEQGYRENPDQVPPIIALDHHGQREHIDGWHRLGGAERAGLTEVPAYVGRVRE